MTVFRKRNKWWVDICLPDGKRVRRVSPVQTKAGALTFEAELRAQSASSTSTPSSTVAATPEPVVVLRQPLRPPAPTLAEFAPEWLRSYAAVNNKPSEVIGKEGNLRNHLLPFFGNLSLDQITARDIEGYKAAKLRGEGRRRSKPYKPKTINNHLATLRTLLNIAVEWNIIDRAPKIRLLKVNDDNFDWLNKAESKTFLTAVDKHYVRWRALFWLALRTGLRRGELFALQWADIDLEGRAVHVRHGVFRGRLQSPKGGRGRTVPMSPRLATVLVDFQEGVRARKSPFLFPAADGSLTKHQDHADRPLKGALKKARLRTSIRFHDLRHSFASQLVASGRTLKEVQELLGHASITTTMRYAHLGADRMRDAVSTLDED